MQVDWLKKNLKKFVDLTTRVNLVQNLLTTKELPVSVGAMQGAMPLSQLFEVLFDSSVVVKYPIF